MSEFYLTPPLGVNEANLYDSQEVVISSPDMNTSWPAISRLEDPKHWPSLRQLEKIANVLGQQLIISM